MSEPISQETKLFDLFEFFASEHGLLLTNDELLEIIETVKTKS